MEKPPKTGSCNRRVAMGVLRLAIFAAILWGIWHTVQKSGTQIAEKSLISLRDIRWDWLTISVLMYAIGTIPAAVFWWRCMQVMGQQVHFFTALRAYFCGGLGKYVPGKAVVVIARSNMVSGPGVDWRVAALSVFVETLTVMAVGALLGAALIASIFPQHQEFLAGALAMAAVVGIPSLPPVFRPIVRWIAKRKGAATDEEIVAKLNLRFLAGSWAGLALGWCLTGASFFAAVNAIPHQADHSLSMFSEVCLATACAGLSVVAGFVTMLPAGIVAREYVILQLLAPIYGTISALTIGALVRLTWLLSELVTSTILYLSGPKVVRPNVVRPKVVDHNKTSTAES